MKKIIVFLFVLLAGCKDTNEDATNPSATYLNISPEESNKLISENKDNSNFIIIDIRTPGEYQSGYIEKAILIDYYSPTFETELQKLDKSKTYLIYCRSGNRTGKTLPTMKNLGFKKVYSLNGGILAWNVSGYPLVF